VADKSTRLLRELQNIEAKVRKSLKTDHGLRSGIDDTSPYLTVDGPGHKTQLVLRLSLENLEDLVDGGRDCALYAKHIGKEAAQIYSFVPGQKEIRRVSVPASHPSV